MTAKLSEYEQDILDNVEEFGCHITTVFDPRGENPSYSYSTGFTETVNQGEVIVFGLGSDLMPRMINNLHDQCARGLVLEDGLRVHGLLEDFAIVVRSIPRERISLEHFNSAMWFHRRTFGTGLSRAFQIVWPGAVHGLFPWDAGADAEVCSLQPPLYPGEIVQ